MEVVGGEWIRGHESEGLLMMMMMRPFFRGLLVDVVVPRFWENGEGGAAVY